MKALKPYQTERQTTNTGIMLDANEHYRQWVKVPNSALTCLNRYPESSALSLRQKLAYNYSNERLQPENILITSGLIEAIDLLITAYKPSTLILNTPSYDVYKLRADVHGSRCEFVPLDSSSQPQVAKILKKASNNSMVVFISPNNPTGNLIDPLLVREVVQQSEGMVVIDEAYIEFAGLQNSMQSLIEANKNVIILRTFSKAWGLAGIRLGYAISDERNIEYLSLYRNTYSVNSVAITIGLHALDQQSELQAEVDSILRQKNTLIKRFELAGIKVRGTEANFIVLDIPKVQAVHQALRRQSILVRPRPLIGSLRQGLRVTVGAPEENEAMFNAVIEALV